MDWNLTTEQYLSYQGMAKKLPEPVEIYLDEDTEITKELVEKLINDHKDQVARFTILHNYYLGYAGILKRQHIDPYKPNNKLVAPYPSYATDILTGMFIGEPIGYSVEENKNSDLEKIQEIFDFNDEQDENFEIAKYNSIMGVSYEIVYVDEDKRIRFNELDPRNVVYVYDTHINPRPLLAIYYRGKDENRIVDVFTRDRLLTYQGSTLELVQEDINDIGKIPIIECRNNTEKLGDWERVLSLIDAYNKAISDTANDFEEFTDAILALYGMLNTEREDIEQLKQDRVLLLDSVNGKQGAEWLIKEINDTAVENHKNRLDEDIHRFTKIPNLSDDKFGGNASGVALKYKLLSLRQVIAAKERKFKRFLQDRLEIILDYAYMLSLGINIEPYDIEITFNPNIPIDEKENVEMVKDLLNITSENTALSQLFFIDNANEEQQKKRDEQEPYSDLVVKYLQELEGVEDEQADRKEDDRATEDSRQRAAETNKEDNQE